MILHVRVEPAFSEVVQGKFEIHGQLEIADEALLLSYSTKNIFGKYSDTQDLEIPFTDINSITLKKRFMSARLIIHPRQLGLMQSMPGEHRSQMIFKVNKEDRKRAEPFTQYLQYKVFDSPQPDGGSVPFSLPSTNMGFTEHEGLLYLEGEFLVFDLQSGIAGGQKEDRHIIKVEPAALHDIQVKPGTVGDSLLIWPKKSTLLKAIPGSHAEGRIKLSVKRKYRDALEHLVTTAANQTIELSDGSAGDVDDEAV